MDIQQAAQDYIRKVGSDISETWDEKKLKRLLGRIRRAQEEKRVVPIDARLIDISQNIREQETSGEKFKKICSDVAKRGILQNIIVELSEKSNNSFQLICRGGHTRVRALLQNLSDKDNLTEDDFNIPCRVVKFDRKGAWALASLSENTMREDLHFLDLAKNYQVIIDNKLMSKDELADHVKRSPKTLERILKVNRLPDEAKQIIRDHEELFNYKYIYDKFLTKSFDGSTVLKSLKSTIAAAERKKTTSSNSSKQKGVVSKAKSERRKKLSEYYLANNINDETKGEIEKALSMLKLI